MPTMAMFLLGLALLVLGADSLLRGAGGLAQRFGARPFLAGLAMAGFVAAIPELSIGAQAIAQGATGLAAGNAVGGGIAGFAMALGLAALLAPFTVSMRSAGPVLVLVLVAAGLLLLFALDGVIARWEGGVLLLAYVGGLGLWFARARGEDARVQAGFVEIAETATGAVQNLVRLGFAAALLFFGSRFVVRAAPEVGASLGLGDFAMGLTLVAFGVALPKLAFVALAAREEGNVVFSVVLGACLASLLLVPGAMAAMQPLPLAEPLARIALPVTMAFALVLYPLFGGELRIDRRRGALLLAGGIAWLGYALWAARA